jgi:hypothetical protein
LRLLYYKKRSGTDYYTKWERLISRIDWLVMVGFGPEARSIAENFHYSRTVEAPLRTAKDWDRADLCNFRILKTKGLVVMHLV